jgi:hypothetical protein
MPLEKKTSSQRKGRKVKDVNTATNWSSETTINNGAVTSIPDGASCWLCLNEGSDESEVPLVWDCSCRGSSGIAHLPFIIAYAEDTMKREAFAASFARCHNCKQKYQNDLSEDLSKAAVGFVVVEWDSCERTVIFVCILDAPREYNARWKQR